MSGQLDAAVIVAVPAVHVMQVAVDEVVGVILVRHGVVAAARAVPVVLRVGAAGMGGRTRAGVVQGALVDVAVVLAVEVALVEVVHVVSVADGRVSAVRAVLVVVRVVRPVVHGDVSGQRWKIRLVSFTTNQL